MARKIASALDGINRPFIFKILGSGESITDAHYVTIAGRWPFLRDHSNTTFADHVASTLDRIDRPCILDVVGRSSSCGGESFVGGDKHNRDKRQVCDEDDGLKNLVHGWRVVFWRMTMSAATIADHSR